MIARVDRHRPVFSLTEVLAVVAASVVWTAALMVLVYIAVR